MAEILQNQGWSRSYISAGMLKEAKVDSPHFTGKPLESPLYIASARNNDDEWSVMPPKENDKLSSKQLIALKRWIDLGALGQTKRRNYGMLLMNAESESPKTAF